MWLKFSGTSLVVGCVVAWPAVGRAEASSCATAYEKAQELRAEQRLREARRSLEACVEPICPEFVRTECGRWLVEVETSLPSVVLAAKIAGREAEKVRVLYDGVALVEALDGKAVPVDPGVHTLAFLAEGVKPVELKVVFREGEKNRIVAAELGDAAKPGQRATQPTAPALPSTAPQGSRSWVPYGLGGLGVLGLTGFAVLGLMGNSELAERERSCAPTCSDSDVSSVKTKYYLADVSLGVGLVSLGVAGYLLLASPHRSGQTPTVGRNSEFDVRFGRNGGYAAVRVEF